MSRYIDADVLLNTVFEVHCKECDKRKGEKNGKYRTIYEVGEAPCKACEVNDMREYLEDAPTADVAPVVRGEWISLHNGYYKCSCCGSYWKLVGTPELNGMYYCLNCGAKMQLDEEDIL